VTSFSAGWLKLREPVDARSRAGALNAFPDPSLRAAVSVGERISIVDLGAGTGSNLRALAPILGGAQDWLLVEQDESLLGVMPERMQAWAGSLGGRFVAAAGAWHLDGPGFECRVRTMTLNLATQLDRLVVPGRALVTASALLDLVSEAWLGRMLRRCARAGAAVWFALTVDGRCRCRPVDPLDAKVAALFLAHQQTDKGFGPALGPGAAKWVPQLLADLGYLARSETSDWLIGPAEAAFQRSLLQGWFEAACEMAPASEPELRPWLERRHAWIDRGESEMLVGHVDVIGWRN
jgi:hypothetical protein